MPVDRHALLRRAEQLALQGRRALAIDEYLRVLEERPADWSAANALGDLYVRENQPARAVEQFIRGADALHADGFTARAAALYRKALRFDPGNAHAIARLKEAPEEKLRAPRVEVDVSREPTAVPVAGDAPRTEAGAARVAPPPDPHAIRVDDIETVPAIELEVVGFDGTPEPAALEDVFAVFREEAAIEASGGAAEAALARGRALYAAGQIEEAIRDLQQAARAPNLRFEAASILGRIHRDRGLLPETIEWFERAAEAPAPSDADGHRLLYELALALEAAGERARSLAVYVELQVAAAGPYLDVAERVRRLEAAGEADSA